MSHSSSHRICIAYTRVSDATQARDGLSLDAQADRLRAYAVAQGPGEVELRVEARSARSIARRPVLQAILDEVRGDRVSALLVFKLDRLARNTIEALGLARVLAEHDCRLVSLSETIDTGSAFGTFFYTVLAALAQMERDQIAERTRAVLQYKRQQGAYLGGAPLGWRKVRGRDGKQTALAPDPDGQALLVYILSLRADGLTQGTIAARLTAEGVPTMRGTWRWHQATICKIIRRYTGCQDDRPGITVGAPVAA